MEDSLKKLIFGLMAFSLVGVLIMTVVLEQGRIYNKDVSVFSDSGDLSITKFNASVSQFYKNATGSSDSFNSKKTWSSAFGVVIEGIFGIVVELGKVILFPFGIIGDILVNVFHVDMLVVRVVQGFIALLIMFAIWSLIKIGQ